MSGPINDKDFYLVSALYHASQGVDRSRGHASDARFRLDKDAQEFFDELSEAYSNIAEKARLLLMKRI